MKALQFTRLNIPEDRDKDFIDKVMGAKWIPLVLPTGSTNGYWDFWDIFAGQYLIDPKDPYSGLNTSGSPITDVYKVKAQETDTAGYLLEKLKADTNSGVVISTTGTSNKTMKLSLDIQESGSTGISLLKDSKTVKKLVAVDGVVITYDDNEITFSATDEKLKTSATDNSNGYLENKLIDGTNTSITKYVDVNGNEALQVNATDNLPEIEAGDAGKKIVVKQDEMGYELVAASTTSGFYDKHAQYLAFDDSTRTLSIIPVNTTFKITNSLGVEYIKTTETIVIPDVNGLHGVYYNENGNLEVFSNENRSQIYNRMLISTPVSYISWSVTSQINNFVTEVLKDRTMSNSTWAKNAFDEEIYRLTGLDSYDVVLEGSGDDNSHAQFGITAGSALWTDHEHTMLVKDTGSNYKVYYKDGTETRFIEKTGFSCLNTVDFGLGDGRIMYNNEGVPTEVNNNDFVFYIIGITNDVEEGRKIVSFMGQNEYATRSIANNNRDEEIANIEQSFGLKQEFSSLYSVLWQTGDGKSNDVHGSIEDFVLIDKTGTNYSSGGSGVPDDLINGSDVGDIYHNHDSIYGSEIENIITVGKADTIDSDVDFNTITDALASVQPLATPTIIVYKGVYNESLTFKPNVPIVGIGNQGDVVINGEHLVDDGDCFLTNLTLTDTTNVDNTYVLRITSDGNLFYRDLLIIDNYSGDIQTTGIKIEGNSYIRGNTLQIQMNKIGTDNSVRNIVAVDAPNLSSDILSINNSISITHNTEDINDNLVGFNYGGTAGIHTSNMIFEANTTNVNYSGNIRPIVYNDNTNPKTFGDITVRVNDAGSGNLLVTEILATSGTFMFNNLIAYYEGSGTAYITNSNSPNIDITIEGYNIQGFTDTTPTGGNITCASGILNGEYTVTSSEPVRFKTYSVDMSESIVSAGQMDITNDLLVGGTSRFEGSTRFVDGADIRLARSGSSDATNSPSGIIVGVNEGIKITGADSFSNGDIQFATLNRDTDVETEVGGYDASIDHWYFGKDVIVNSSIIANNVYSGFLASSQNNPSTNPIYLGSDIIGFGRTITCKTLYGGDLILEARATGGNVISTGATGAGSYADMGFQVTDANRELTRDILTYDKDAGTVGEWDFQGVPIRNVPSINLTGDLDLNGNNIIDVDTINPDGEAIIFGGNLDIGNKNIISNDKITTKTTNDLGTVTNDYVLSKKHQHSGNVNSNNREETWLYRRGNGSDWITADWWTGICIDSAYATPMNSRTWYKRRPGIGAHFFGDIDITMMAIERNLITSYVDVEVKGDVEISDDLHIDGIINPDGELTDFGGSIKVSSDDFRMLELMRNSTTDGSAIRFSNTTETLGDLAFSGDKTFSIRPAGNTAFELSGLGNLEVAGGYKSTEKTITLTSNQTLTSSTIGSNMRINNSTTTDYTLTLPLASTCVGLRVDFWMVFYASGAGGDCNIVANASDNIFYTMGDTTDGFRIQGGIYAETVTMLATSDNAWMVVSSTAGNYEAP